MFLFLKTSYKLCMIEFYNLSNGQEDFFCISIKVKYDRVNILVDGGTGNKFSDSIEFLERHNIKDLHYIILTHIDNDHINGIIKLLKQKEYIKQPVIVYNKCTSGYISFKQAEEFENLIRDYENIVSFKEYQESKGKIVFLSTSQREKLYKKNNVIYCTFLSPNKDVVKKVYDNYIYYKDLKKIKSKNEKLINKSSIIFLLEFKNITILMTGDGYISDIKDNLIKLTTSIMCPIKDIQLFKLPHHGSKENNLGIEEIFEKINCEKIIITNNIKPLKKRDVKLEDNLIKEIKEKKVYCSSFGGTYKDKSEELNIMKNNKINLD